jgi:CheY-like chemotaxis protein
MVAQRESTMTGKELYGPVGAKEPILFNGKLGWIRVFCKECNIDYDIREVDNETTHPTAAHVARFDCPKGHHCEARRVWNSYDDDFLKACGIEALMEQQIGQARPASEGVKASTRREGQKAERIIVVNDEELIRKLICAILASAGYQCRGVAGGLEALALFESGEESDLLLCDLRNPFLDGISLLERTTERFPNVPVVFVTCDDSALQGCISRGAHDYLMMPFVHEQLLWSVRHALEHRRLKLEMLENRRLRKRGAK